MIRLIRDFFVSPGCLCCAIFLSAGCACVEAKLHGESRVIQDVLMIKKMITKDDDKGDDKKLKGHHLC